MAKTEKTVTQDLPKANPTDTQDSPKANAASDAAELAYPRKVTVTNNTPIPLYLSECKVSLEPNFHAPQNSAEATFLTEEHFKREMSNVEAIAAAHGFTDALIVSEIQE